VARILALNVYDLAAAEADVAAGRAPDQVLYGLNHFPRRGYTVQVVPYRASPRLTRLSGWLRRSPVRLGDLDQQRSALRLLKDADLVYCPNQGVSELLGLLRAAHVIDVPIVWVVHHPLDCGRLRSVRRPVTRAIVHGLDAYPALTDPVARDLAALAGRRGHGGTLRFGPDPAWYPRPSALGRGVVAAGRSGRDFGTFARAIGATTVPGVIVCPRSLAPRAPAAPNLRTITYAEGDGFAPAEIIDLLAGARAVAIPLAVGWPFTMNGLGAIADALGLGKPVIVTRTPWLDLDVERLGIGFAVDPGDVRGWRAAIERLDREPEMARDMGRRARALVDDGTYSSVTFAQQVMDIFDRILGS
jgi:glycosyltransferase involved in cell wall biosynthesis